MVENGLKAYGYEPDPRVGEIFTKYRKTHNQGVFDAYTPSIRAARSSHIITGLPDAYGRGRIIGDYRRVALYGVDRLIVAKKAELATLDDRLSSDAIIRDREELNEQIRALAELVELGDMHGLDLRRPAVTAQEAIQWLYMAYLGSIKEQNGAAMSLGRVSTFLDVFLQRDIDAGALTESGRPGARRRLRDQAADGALPAHPRVRRAVLRRPDLGHRVDRRHGLRRPAAGHPLVVPVPADAVQPGPGARAEPDRPVVRRPCPRASRSSARRSPSTPRPSSTSPTTCCASSTRAATTARSPAACRACRSASGCSSSAPG